MTVADDYGRYYASPVNLRVGCWPTCPEKVNESQILEWLEECTRGPRPLMYFYESEGVRYLQVTDFGQQTRAKSKFPQPENICLAVANQPQIECVADAQPSRIRISDSESCKTPPPPEVNARKAVEQIRGFDTHDWFEEVYTRHPKKKDRGLAMNYLVEASSSSGFSREEFDRVHRLWCLEWAKDKPQFGPTLAQWILDVGWKYPPGVEKNGAGPANPAHIPFGPDKYAEWTDK